MKNFSIQPFVLLVVMICIELPMMNGQSLDRSVISSSGQNFTGSAGTLTFTLGEPVVATLNSAIELSQGFHQEWAIVTAVDNEFADQFHVAIYPNPTTGWLNITSDMLVHLSLFDLSGKNVFQGEKEAGTVNINIGDLAPGLYLLVMYDDAGKKATYKVQVVK